ncbi:MAG TPA: MMPL family transporter, partial [Actinomycetota bacterium]|nr:MMPL family transporter [Actinomycetota bacterium]
RDGVRRIRAGLGEARAGLDRLAAEVVEPARRNLEEAWGDLKRATVAKADPVYRDVVQSVGTALALVSGRCPDASGMGLPLLVVEEQACEPGSRVAPGYDGLAAALREVSSGLGRARDGLARIDDGLAELAGGLRSAGPGIDRLADGVERMIGGLDRIIPGLSQLYRGLVVGFAQAERAGLIPAGSGDVALTASLVRAFPKLREQLSFFVGERGRSTRLFVTLDSPPYEASALDTSMEVRDLAELSLAKTPLDAASVSTTGGSAFFADVRDIQSRDFRKIVWVVVLGIFLVLALLLRSVVAPIYLVLTVMLSFLSTLGIATMVFQGLLGHDGITWWIPPFLFVMLVALGADYNIFLTSRIREEAERTDTREAVARGLTLTGHVITSAGLILAGTFAALLFTPMQGLIQMGFATSIGILIDTFIVRSLVVPAFAVLLGRHNWWPSRRARTA